MTTNIGVTTNFIGFHCWENAPAHRAYLATPHRHLFGVKVAMTVTKHDREIEYHDLLDAVRLSLPDAASPANDFVKFSCEHHANRIATILSGLYPNRSIVVTVDEDGECFSTVSIK